ncbi:MAG TPA: tetratricopeptide repeat protein [Kofleriaceae bacterium]|nr:tetratricopeptide repeat protein [Kofleriaceae bacterium]
MRVLVVLLCLCGLASADAPALRSAKADYPAEALQEFARGVVWAKLGDDREAMLLFQRANDRSPQANTYWNIGVLYLRQEDLEKALYAFEKALELAPKSDRAEIEKVIKQTKQTKAQWTVWISVDHGPPRALVLVDGVAIGPSPATFEPKPGEHNVQAFSKGGFYAQRDVHYDDQRIDERLSGVMLEPHENKGNVFIDVGFHTTYSTWKQGTTTYSMNKPFPLPVGHYKAVPTEIGRTFCTPIEFDVKSTTDITYVLVDYEDGNSCKRIKRTTVQSLRLP